MVGDEQEATEQDLSVSTGGPALQLADTAVAAPTTLTPQLSSELWCKPRTPGAKWQKRHAVAAANFVYLFKEADATIRGRAPEAVLCFEDMSYAPSDVPEEDVARCSDLFTISEFGFELLPPLATVPPQSLSFRSLSAFGSPRGVRSVGYAFCAEDAETRRRWAAVLKRGRCSALSEDVRSLRTELECKELELRELKRVLAEALGAVDGGVTRSHSLSRDGSHEDSGGHDSGSEAASIIRRAPSEKELEDASVRLQAIARGKLSRQRTHATKGFQARGTSTTKTRAGRRSTMNFMSGIANAIGGAVTAVMEAGSEKDKDKDKEDEPRRRSPSKGAPPPPPPVADDNGGGNGSADDDIDELEETRRELGLSPARGGGQAGSGANSSAAEAVSALHERGEKLQTLANVAGNLATETESFAANATKLRQQAQRESKSWF